jgi:UDP-N-acetylmuramyl pentapeptide phosphotransferase/UDP-N-acetylglucosamine-1-phosphate transferase
VCLGVFVAELLTTIVRRIGSGRSLVLGDRDHAYDVTARRLGSRTRSTVLFWALGAASALVATGIEASRMGVGIALTAAYGCLALAAGALLRRQAKEMA